MRSPSWAVNPLIQPSQNVEARLVSELQVQNENIRIERLDRLQAVVGAAASGQHFEIRLGVQELLQSVQDEWMIVYEHKADAHQVITFAKGSLIESSLPVSSDFSRRSPRNSATRSFSVKGPRFISFNALRS